MEYQDDPNVRNMEDRYLSGNALMVAPIYTQDNKRMVCFPKGVWTDWHTGEKIHGGVWKEIRVTVRMQKRLRLCHKRKPEGGGAQSPPPYFNSPTGNP